MDDSDDWLSPPHEVRDPEKLAALEDSMREHGWLGVPLVRWGHQLLTGSHRYEAARRSRVDIPTIDLHAVFAEDGEEWTDTEEEFEWNIAERVSLFDAIVQVLSHLSWHIREKYGLDT